MKKLGRLLAYLSALLSGATLVELTSTRRLLLLLPKTLGAALAPFWAVAGGLGALISLWQRDFVALWAGLLGATLAARHVSRVIAPHGGFERAFGPNWQARIPPTLRARMLETRWPIRLPDTPGVTWQRDVVCGTTDGGEPLLGDLWQPPADAPTTGLAVIYLHGSAWHYGNKDMLTRPFFRHLAGQGHVILDLGYTLAPKAHLHEMVGDVKRAVAWMKAHAGQYGVNPERIVLMGGSAGGQLALLAGYTPDHAELRPADVDSEMDLSVRAVVSYYGPPDLRAFHDYAASVLGGLWAADRTWLSESGMAALVSQVRLMNIAVPEGRIVVGPAQMIPSFLGGSPDDVPDLYELASPIHHVGPHCPPTLLLQGGHDLVVRPGPVRRLHQALCQTGVASVYVEFPATDHGFDLMFPTWNPAAQAALYDVERFLALMV